MTWDESRVPHRLLPLVHFNAAHVHNAVYLLHDALISMGAKRTPNNNNSWKKCAAVTTDILASEYNLDINFSLHDNALHICYVTNVVLV